MCLVTASKLEKSKNLVIDVPSLNIKEKENVDKRNKVYRIIFILRIISVNSQLLKAHCRGSSFWSDLIKVLESRHCGNFTLEHLH